MERKKLYAWLHRAFYILSLSLWIVFFFCFLSFFFSFIAKSSLFICAFELIMRALPLLAFFLLLLLFVPLSCITIPFGFDIMFYAHAHKCTAWLSSIRFVRAVVFLFSPVVISLFKSHFPHCFEASIHDINFRSLWISRFFVLFCFAQLMMVMEMMAMFTGCIVTDFAKRYIVVEFDISRQGSETFDKHFCHKWNELLSCILPVWARKLYLFASSISWQVFTRQKRSYFIQQKCDNFFLALTISWFHFAFDLFS